jgi:uncharacterized protein YjbI with pentapeptide repeats
MLEGLSFSIAKDWISRLYGELTGIRKTREKELTRLADLFGDPEALAKFYIEPDCQQFNPADENEDEGPLVIRQPILQTLEQYIAVERNYSKRQMFLLSDAGMGKTSILLMLKLSHLTSFWPRGYHCELLKLGPKSLEEISAIPAKPDTVLLLDALDEDPLAWDNVTARIRDLLVATESFKRVIITCRTQFFSGGTDPFNRRGQVEVAGFLCPAIFNSLFSDAQVDAYLERRSVLNSDPSAWKKRALQIVNSMGSLRMRPMLLSHIDDFMDSNESVWNHYTIYRALVSAWLLREQRKIQSAAEAYPTIEELKRACHVVALHMHSTGERVISQSNLEMLVQKHAETKNIRFMHIGGRSLLNRDSLGNYRFSHYSIQEFLVADAVFTSGIPIDRESFRSTDVMKHLFAAWIAVAPSKDRQGASVELLPLDRASFAGQDLQGMNFSGMSLDGTNFNGSDLRDAIFDNCSLVGASFEGSNLQAARIVRCNATGADFTRSDLRSAELFGTNFRSAQFRDSSLQGAQYDADTFWSYSVLPAASGAICTRDAKR